MNFSDVHFAEYDVLLSYPDYKNPNRVQIVNTQTGKISYTSEGVSKVVIPAEQGAPGRH